MIPFLSSLLSIVPNVVGAVSDNIKHKRQLKQEIQTKKIQLVKDAQEIDASWEAEQAKGSRESWKDEFWTLVFGYILLSPLWAPEQAQTIFETFSKAPDWFQLCVLVSVGASFGVKVWKGLGK